MSLSKIISAGSTANQSPVGELTSRLSSITAKKAYSDPALGEMSLSMESVDATARESMVSTYRGLQTDIKSTAREISAKLGVSLEDYNITAASIASLVGTSPEKALSSKPEAPNGVEVIRHGFGAGTNGTLERPTIAAEAYDERENRNAQLYSIVYNLLASRQDDFGETLFPTLIVSPDEVGAMVEIKLFYVYNDFKRAVTGALANYARKNVVRAYADASILNNEVTRAVPVLRATGGADDNTAVFVDPADVPARTENLGNGVTVQTAPLKSDANVDLIGLSQTDELLNSGMMSASDTLDTYLKLKTVYIKVTDGSDTDVIAIQTESFPDSNYVFAVQGNYRKMSLVMDGDNAVLDSNTTNVTGGALTYLTELATHSARIRMNINSSVILDKGNITFSASGLELTTLRDASGNLVTGTTFDNLAAKIANGTVIGYDVTAWRANSNLRQRGRLVDTQIERKAIAVLYRSPIAAIMPVVGSSENDNSVLESLISTTGIRISNDAVTTLIDFDATMGAYNPVPDVDGNLPQLGVIGEYYVKPTYYSEAINLATTVDSVASHERIKDIRSALVEKIRYYANEMWRTSEYKAAASMLTGNIGFKPTVIVATDPVIYNYISSDGDLRTLGDTFDVKVVSTLDSRIKGKAFITFGVFNDNARNEQINPLNFGNMLYSPELTTVLPISRDGQISKELIVTPRYLHIVNLPIMTRLDVTGLPEVTSKVAINTHNV